MVILEVFANCHCHTHRAVLFEKFHGCVCIGVWVHCTNIKGILAISLWALTAEHFAEYTDGAALTELLLILVLVVFAFKDTFLLNDFQPLKAVTTKFATIIPVDAVKHLLFGKLHWLSTSFPAVDAFDDANCSKCPATARAFLLDQPKKPARAR